jgi:hypothetical protein
LSASISAVNNATSPVRISTSFNPKAEVASSASASISASAAARSCRPKDSMPACRNSLGRPPR